MDVEKEESNGNGGGGGTEKTLSQGDSEALKKCLEENRGDHTKCKSKVEAFQSSSSSSPSKKTLRRTLMLRSGSLTDV